MIFLISILIAVAILNLQQTRDLIALTGTWGYAGVFLAGLFFSYLFTSPLATASILILAETHNPFIMAILGGFGALISDLIIYRFVKSSLHSFSTELKKLKLIITSHIPHPFRRKSKVKSWLGKNLRFLIPVFAGFIIASPLPDELGICLLGTTKISMRTFVIVSFLLNSLGIFVIAWLGILF